MTSVSRIVVTATGAAATIVLARLLGPAGWGSYFVAQSLLLILSVAVGLGIEHGLAYYVGSRRWAPRAAFRSALGAAVILGLVGAGIGLGARMIAPSAFAGLSVWMVAIVVAALPFALARFYVSYIALAIDRYEAYAVMSAAHALLGLALAIPAAIVFGTEGAIAATSAAMVAAGTVSALWAHRRLPGDGHAPGHLRRAISFGVKGYVANALQSLNYRVDVFMLSAVAATTVVGSYSLAVAVTSLMWLLPGALSDVLFPRVARLSGDESAREVVEIKSLRHATIVVAAGIVVITLFLVFLVVPIFGEDFQSAIELGLILLPGTALLGIASVVAAIVVGRGKPTYSLYGALVLTPLTLGLYALMVPSFEATGAAVASTLSYSAGFLLMGWFYRRVTGRPLRSSLVPRSSELDDLRALPSSFAARLRAIRCGGEPT